MTGVDTGISGVGELEQGNLAKANLAEANLAEANRAQGRRSVPNARSVELDLGFGERCPP